MIISPYTNAWRIFSKVNHLETLPPQTEVNVGNLTVHHKNMGNLLIHFLVCTVYALCVRCSHFTATQTSSRKLETQLRLFRVQFIQTSREFLII